MDGDKHRLQIELQNIDAKQFRYWLQSEFQRRLRRNPRYSLRAFARQLDVDPSTLSKCLSGKRKITKRFINMVCEKASEDSLAMLTRAVKDEYYKLSYDVWEVIADWHHYAILEATYINNFSVNPTAVAQLLGISFEDAKMAIDRLERLGLMQRTGKTYKKTHKFLTNGTAVDTSSAHKELQKQVIEKAANAIDETPQKLKEIRSYTFAINTNKLDEARELFDEFQRKLDKLMSAGELTEVYQMGFQLYPLSKNYSNKPKATKASG